MRLSESRSLSWPVGFLLAAPLVVLAVWIARGAVSRSFGPSLAPTAAPGPAAGSSATLVADFPPPDGDLPADRLHEKVDGAEDALRAAGCGRLLYWRLEDPPSEVEVLVFDDAEGAARVLERDAGPERTDGPGDEASAGGQAVLFRRGRFYVRVFGDPGASSGLGRLLDLAARVDSGLGTGRSEAP